MGVRTAADENIEEVKELINKAYYKLHDAIDFDTWGSDEFSNEYLHKIHKAMEKLRKLNSKL